MKNRWQKGFSVIEIIIVIFVIALLAGAGWYVWGKNHGGQQSGNSAQKSSDSNQSTTEAQKMTDAEVSDANTALANGVTVNDAQNDWYQFPAGSIQGDGRPDNTSPYPLPYTDIKNVSFGASGNYIYFKFTYWGAMPASLPSYNGDDVKFYCDNVSISKYTDSNGQTQNGMWQIGTSYIQNLDNTKSTEATTNYRAVTPTVGLTNMGGQTGTDQHGEATYAIQNGRGLVYGGPGYDYVLAGFPLDDLGLKIGDTVEFSVSYEDASYTYHHQSVDLLLDDGQKEGDSIRYVIGSNTYENLGVHI